MCRIHQPRDAFEITEEERQQDAERWAEFRASPALRCMVLDPPSNFSYEMGRTWATVQIASQDFFVQTGGVVPPILYLESFCS